MPARQGISDTFNAASAAVISCSDNQDFLPTLPDGVADLVITSPPYNLGKSYERRSSLDQYVNGQRTTIAQCLRVLGDRGSICWQVGNYVENGAIVPLDILLYPLFAERGLVLRNRIVWAFGHGLHSKQRFSGRYETVLWFTRPGAYCFDLDSVRVPQKYPGKRHFKGPRIGEYSGHPLGKNPGDVWEIPNVKANHVEKTTHQCQFPIALVQRLVRALTPSDGVVLDPYLGVGSAACAAIIEGRQAIGCELDADYAEVARLRVAAALDGTLPYRPLERSIYEPKPGTPLTERRP